MNILLINHYAGSSELGMEFRPYYLAKEWVKLGHTVTIVGGSYSHLRHEQPKVKGAFTNESKEGINYIWIKTISYKGNGAKRVLSFFNFVFGLFFFSKKLLKISNPDCVIASSTYPLDIFPAKLLARRAGAKLCFEVHDLWPLTLILLGGYSERHPLIRILQYSENYAYKNADVVVSMLGNAKAYMIIHGMAENKFVHIPNGYFEGDLLQDLALPLEHKICLDKLRKEGKTLIGYAGGHSVSNALMTLIDVAEILRGNMELAFVLVGDGIEKNRLMEEVESRGLVNVKFLPRISKRAIPLLLERFDILYLGWSYSPLYEHGISPNKLIDYMLAAKPIIHAVSSKVDLVEEADCGFSVPSNKPKLIAEAIERLHKLDKGTKHRMGLRGASYAHDNLNYKTLAIRFLNAVHP
ncbi:MAG: glycosyltransferase involved in cell wall biosynthesis [Arcticibacterium sp.]|jgi:glycosyltransferase involved in cell wall biosynthesis